VTLCGAGSSCTVVLTVFDIYRVRVLFPIMHTFVNLRVEAAPAPL